jgi:hypothetical protein
VIFRRRADDASMMTFLRSFGWMLLLAQPLRAQGQAPVEPSALPSPEQSMAPAKPSVEQIDETHFRVGLLTFDRKTREIRLPAAVNMTEGWLEFAIVQRQGKVHESLLVTDVSPLHLAVALKLLRFPASPLKEGPFEPNKASRFELEVEWRDGDRTRRVPLREWIQHEPTAGTLPPGPWVYTGAEDDRGALAAGAEPVAIFGGNPALLHYAGKDFQNDEVWLPFPKRVPAVGTPVTLILTPAPPEP